MRCERTYVRHATERMFGRQARPFSASSPIIPWCGAERRSVGLPGLRIQISLEPRRLGDVRVAVDDRVTAGKRLDESSGPTGRRPGVVDDPDSHAFVLDDELRREDETKRPARPCFRRRRRPAPACPAPRSTATTRSRPRGGSGRTRASRRRHSFGRRRVPRGMCVSEMTASFRRRRPVNAPSR